MNIFERIQTNRFEDFCTEVLVGILEKDENYKLLQDFCVNEELLNIKEAKDDKSIKIKSQFCPPEENNNQNKSRIDIQITGENFICFLEMKVESSQGIEAITVEDGEKEKKSQLKKYHDCLINLKPSKKEYLRFCTKYNEQVLKEDLKIFNEFREDESYFKCFRWYKIHDFLKKDKENDSLIKEFLDFLELKNMSHLIGNIDYDEKTAKTFFIMLSNLKKVLERVKQENTEFPDIRITGIPQLRLDDYKRYGYSIPLEDRKLGDSRWDTNAFIGFDFDESDTVSQLIWLWSKDYDTGTLNNWKFKSETQDIVREKGKRVSGLRVQKELKDSTQLQEIYDWFINELQNIEKN